jgi:thiol-disulfide isomerase/thioredoxin
MEKKILVFISVMMALGLVLGSLLYLYVGEGQGLFTNQNNDGPGSGDDGPDPNEGLTLARDFTLPEVGGGTLSLSSLRGKVVVLDFMATWCGPCSAEIPHLKEIEQAYDSRVVIISIDVDETESDALLTSYAAEKGVTWPILRDMTDVSSKSGYEVTNIPTLVVINQDGYIELRSVGITSSEDLKGVIDPLL